METSPHMWRKRSTDIDRLAELRNISTYVEKTEDGKFYTLDGKKHLHICGENLLMMLMPRPVVETSPHMWRKLRIHAVTKLSERNISTYVEKTTATFALFVNRQKHLHICGENVSGSMASGRV